MTRSARVAHAVTAIRQARAAEDALSVAASMKFVVFEDNGGGYRWTIVAGSGESLAQSASLASYEEAKQAARIVRYGAASAPFEERPGDTSPIDLVDRRDAAIARDDFSADAERWLDEGGSFSSEAVTRSPAGL